VRSADDNPTDSEEGTPESSPLGRSHGYVASYDPGLLFPVARATSRRKIGVGSDLPFHGEDLWNAYELSWLSTGGLPVVRVATLRFAAHSPNLIESKSLKLYLNSLNNSTFESDAHVRDVIMQDLERASGASVAVDFSAPSLSSDWQATSMEAWCIDDDRVSIDTYEVNPEFLKDSANGDVVGATVYSNLLRSVCPVTGQPDWGTVQIRYQGIWIEHRALLRYIVSFRNHADFHEHCVERMFMDIKRYCEPVKLSVYARYTRRGGLDINPFRSDYEAPPANVRHERQ
jgi:7-cyano-7-deazaguanine reductase